MSSVHSLIQLWRKAIFLMHGMFLHATVQMGVIRFKVLILISTTVQWNILTPPESTFLLWIYIESLLVFWMSVIHSIIQMLPYMRKSVSLHHPIIWTGLKNLNTMYLSINMMVHFVFDAWMEYRGGKPYGQQWNRIFDAVVKILKYTKSTIDYAIKIKVFSDLTVSYLTVCTDDFLNTLLIMIQNLLD